MTNTEFEILKSESARCSIEKHIGEDPLKVALRLRGGDAALVCSQIKYLQRAKTKLPSYYAARCIIPPLAYEQCSSEAAAATKEYSGEFCIDLTCGLGVDALNFSRRFVRVVAVERDAVLADIARHNFALLGATNIEVVTSSAEDFLAGYAGRRADMIFVDPARRADDGRRVFLPADCSPDIEALMPRMLMHADKVVLKLSPLMDVQEVLRLFPGCVSGLEVVSIGNECKELVAEICESAANVNITVKTDRGSYEFGAEDIGLKPLDFNDPVQEYGFLLIPDAGFYKARLTVALALKYAADVELITTEGFMFSKEAVKDLPARIFRIARAESYEPKRIKKALRREGIKKLSIIRRNFPFSLDQIKTDLGITEGGERLAAFTKINDGNYVLFLETV